MGNSKFHRYLISRFYAKIYLHYLLNTKIWMLGVTWEQAKIRVNSKAECRRRMPQCSHLDARWTKV